MSVQISLLNHACIKLEIEDVSLLFDPWLLGTCFKNGWGLHYKNNNAIDEAVTATHLWISHFHGDHLHIPTLKEIVSKNDGIKLLANKSLNFDMGPILSDVGFKNIIPLPEREKIQLSKNVTVIRYPTAGIDNILLILTPSCTILNYNDVNLPSRSLRALIKKFPKIDILFSNFNDAQILECPLRDPDTVKKEHAQQFLGILKIIQPRWVIPFASLHWYLNHASREEQNKTLLTNTELKTWVEKLGAESKSILLLNVGQKVEFNDKTESPQISGESGMEHHIDELDYVKPSSSSPDEILEVAIQFIKNIKKKNKFYQFTMKPLRIFIHDFNKVLVIDKKGCFYSKYSEHRDISSYSGELKNWFTSDSGTDSFFLGAHFKTESSNLLPLKRLFLCGLLDTNQLTPSDLMNYFKSSLGRRFLWCRREEILGTFLSRAFRMGSRF